MVGGHSKIKSKEDLQLLRSHAIIWFRVYAEEHLKIIQFPGKSGKSGGWAVPLGVTLLRLFFQPACSQVLLTMETEVILKLSGWFYTLVCAHLHLAVALRFFLEKVNQERIFVVELFWPSVIWLIHFKHMVTNCLSTLLCTYQENQSKDSIIRWAGLDGMYVFWLHTLVAEGRKRPVHTLHMDSFSLNMMTSVNALVPWLLLVFYGLLTR